jgi:S-formylglutathione hydrolase FrmB
MNTKTLPILFYAAFQYLAFPAFSADVDTVEVYSRSMQKNIRCVYITPEKMKKNLHYPVVYLLHGWSGNYAQWISEVPELTKQSELYQMILVCPDGGYGSWYFDSPIDSNYKYETFISQELINYTDIHYPTITHSKGRAITGLSMGGHGGLFLSLRHADIYGAGGSICGGVDYTPFPNYWNLKDRLGDSACCWNNWLQNTVMAQASKYKNTGLRIIFDCGVSDFFINVNRKLHEHMLALNIPHEYIERPGEHNTAYWRNAVVYQLMFFHKCFQG